MPTLLLQQSALADRIIAQEADLPAQGDARLVAIIAAPTKKAVERTLMAVVYQRDGSSQPCSSLFRPNSLDEVTGRLAARPATTGLPHGPRLG